MKIVIDYSSTKREINGAFNICASREDIASIASQLQDRLRDESWSYGWIAVNPPMKLLANTKPRNWDE